MITLRLTIRAETTHEAYLALQIAAAEFLAGEPKYDSDSEESSISFEVIEDEPTPA